MKKLFTIIFVLFVAAVIFAQQKKKIKGTVSYVSSQFTYVKFNSTRGLNLNDTLFVEAERKLVPKLIVNALSSHSVAAKVIGGKIKRGRSVIAFVNSENKVKLAKGNFAKKIKEQQNEKHKRKIIKRRKRPVAVKNTRGKLSVSGYSNLSNLSGTTDYQNWRYSFSLDADRIGDSKFSFSNYIVFNYRADKWHLLSDNLGNALKVYELAGRYDFDKKTKLVLGRNINPRISNIGAVDGIQFETAWKNFNVGGVVGSRPDFNNYGFNLKLFQIGGYVSRVDSIAKGTMQNTVSLFQQMNAGFTDRRFLYLQHSNNIIKKVNVFFSSEVDLFQKINGKNSNSLRLTSIYLSARYSPYRWISFYTSYDARKNVIYYETFKNYAFRLLDEALRQGFRFRINLRPVRYVYASVYTGYRFRDSDVKPTKNFGASVTHSRVPYLNLSVNLSLIYLNTNYLSGSVWGFGLSKSFMSGILTSSLSYRNVNYKFLKGKYSLLQNIFSADLSITLSKMFFLTLSFEGTYKEKESYSNIYFNFTTRF